MDSLATRASLAAIMSLATALATQPATASVSCRVKPSPEGYTNIRAEPSLSAPIIGQIRYQPHCYVNQGRVPEVTRGNWGLFSVISACGPRNVSGWIHHSQLDDCG